MWPPVDIESRRSRIQEESPSLASIGKLPFDVLTKVFIEYCENIHGGRGPLTISAVSRWWREVILATPMAWCFIESTERISAQGLSMFFERGSPYLYHIALGRSFSMGPTATSLRNKIKVIEENIHRLKCVSYLTDIPHMLQYAYPNLTRLQAHESLIPLEALSRSNYPVLRFLEVGTLISSHPFPPVDHLVNELVELIIGPDHLNAWVVLLEANASSLISLFLPLPERDALVPLGQVHTVYLPSLVHLNTSQFFWLWKPRTVGPAGYWPVRLATPNLLRYSHGAIVPEPSIDRSQVTHLNCCSIPSLSEYSQLKYLELCVVSIEAVEIMIDGIMHSNLLVPYLETIKYTVYRGNLPDIRILKEKLVERKKITGYETRFSTSWLAQRFAPSDLVCCLFRTILNLIIYIVR